MEALATSRSDGLRDVILDLGNCLKDPHYSADTNAHLVGYLLGHKTRAVFDRYHIVSERRMKQNAEKLEAHLKAKEAAEALTDKQGGLIEVL